MLFQHLNLTAKEVSLRLQGRYKEEIEAFNEVEEEALMMADYFTNGIISQFPQKFKIMLYMRVMDDACFVVSVFS